MLAGHTRDEHRSRLEKECAKDDNDKVPKSFLPNAAKLSRKEQEKIDDTLKRMITGCNLAFALVDHTEFRNFTQALNPLYVAPSRNTLKNWLMADFEKYKRKVRTVAHVFLNSVIISNSVCGTIN